MRRHRLAVLLHHPIHYHAPLMRELAADPELDVQVYFCFDHGVRRRRDEEFGVEYTWDIPLLDGYAHAFLRNWSPRPSTAPITGVFNPGIWRRIRRGNFDAVIVHGYVSPTVWLAILAAWSSGTPVLMRGESTLLYERSVWIRAVKRLFLRAVFSAVDSFLYVGTRNREFYESFGIARERFAFVPYCVDNESFFRTQAEDADLRARTRASLGVAEGEPVILFAGKLIARKRPMDLLWAYKAIVADHPEAHLALVGEGAARPEIEAFVRTHGLQRVHLLGFKNRLQIPAYYACADLFVLPSHHDPWGLVVNEAMCFGLPVIATTLVGCTRDLVSNGENGFVYPAGDVLALTGYLRVLVSDAPRRARMGHLSRDRIRRWSFAECVDGIKAAIRAAQMAGAR
jgi:glycosyltransferase involved in cell wall biosynthesis